MHNLYELRSKASKGWGLLRSKIALATISTYSAIVLILYALKGNYTINFLGYYFIFLLLWLLFVALIVLSYVFFFQFIADLINFFAEYFKFLAEKQVIIFVGSAVVGLATVIVVNAGKESEGL